MRQIACVTIATALALFQASAAPSFRKWAMNEDGREVLLFFDEALADAATNAATWTLSRATVESARFFADRTGVAIRLVKPLDTRNTYSLSGTVTAQSAAGGGLEPCSLNGVSVKRPKPLGLPNRLVEGAVESAGPASRRSPISVTEVMVAPAPREDGRDLRFVELYNANPYFEQIGKFRISGMFAYTFPAGTKLAGRSSVVIAANAADVKAVYGIDAVVQAQEVVDGFPAEIKVEDEQQAVLGELTIKNDVPWPTGIAGGGHSLVLARPSYGWTNPDGWSRSAFAGGSPGRMDPARPTKYAGLLINEVLPHGGADEGYVELYDTSDETRSLGGCTLEVAGTTRIATIAERESIPVHRTAVFEEGKLGFPIGGEGIELLLRAPASEGGYLIDAVRVPPTEIGRSYGRWPDGGPLLSRLESPTRNERNLPRAKSDLVLSEIMYHPITEEKDHEYLEVRNLSGEERVLKDWSIDGSIEYNFKKADVVGPYGYLAIARNREVFGALYPSVSNLASKGYSGSLPNGRGLVRLRCGMTVWSSAEGAEIEADVPIEEVEYRDGGVWGKWSDGGGSSLERVDAQADARLPGSWADSDETRTCDWKTISCTAKTAIGFPRNPYGVQDAVEFGLYDAGECLVDEVTLKSESGSNLVLDPSFENGNSSNTWRSYGTHRNSTIESGDASSGNKALHVRACDTLAVGGNSVRGKLSSALTTNGRETLSVRVRWLAGSPDFLVKAKGNWIEAFGNLLTTYAMGTPGRANSRVREGMPCISEMLHLPILPRVTESVRVWARAECAEGLSGLDLFWTNDGGSGRVTNTVAMTAADGGWWWGEIPAQQTANLLSFHVEARSAGTNLLASRFPDAFDALVRFGESKVQTAFPDYRVWITQSEITAWKNQVMDSNEPHPCTFVYSGERAIYGASIEYGGSNWHATNTNRGATPGDSSRNLDYKPSFPKDDLVHGDNGLVLAVPGNGANDSTTVKEQYAYALLRRVGCPYMNRMFVRFYFNGSLQNRFGIYEDTEKPNGDVMDKWHPDGGRLYKMNCWCEYANIDTTDYDADRGVKFDDTQYRMTDETGATVYYDGLLRWHFQMRSFPNFAPGDLENVKTMLAAVNANPALPDAELNRYLPAEAYSRTLAVEHFVGNWDGYGNNGGGGKNMYICDGPRGFEFIVWDIDMSFGDGNLPLNETLTPASFPGIEDPMLKRIMARPLYLRKYWQAVKMCVEGAKAGAPEYDAITEKYNAVRASGANVSTLSTYLANIETRRAYAASAVAQNDVAAFSLTFPSGRNVSVATNSLQLTGTAPFVIDEIRANDQPLELTWTSATTWSSRLTLTQPTTDVRLTAYTKEGTFAGEITLTVHAVLPEPPPRTVALNEFLAQNSQSVNPVTGDYDDWFELCNYGTRAVDLSGWLVTDTLVSDNPPIPSTKASKVLVFPDGTILEPHAVLLVWTGGVDAADPLASPPQAPFGLSKSADLICLFDAETNLVDRVDYATTQLSDVSMGRWPNGQGDWIAFSNPTPGALNEEAGAAAVQSVHVSDVPRLNIGVLTAAPSEKCVSFTLNGPLPEGCRVEMSTNLSAGCWTPVDFSVEKLPNGSTRLKVDGAALRPLPPAAFFRLRELK